MLVFVKAEEMVVTKVDMLDNSTVERMVSSKVSLRAGL